MRFRRAPARQVHSRRPDPPRTGLRERHEPEKTVLYRVVQRDLATFLAEVEADGERTLPRFVPREFERFLKCGIPAHGFARIHCDDCGRDEIVAFSCKTRGVCPSCGGRRMADTAAHLVDRVIPHVPVRQWVLSLPHRLRYVLAYNRDLVGVALGVFVRAVLAFNVRRARKAGLGRGESGAVTFIQRFGSALNLNVHFHTAALDGVYVLPPGATTPAFHPLPAPTDDEIARLLATVRRRIVRALSRRGVALGDDDPSFGVDDFAEQEPAMAALCGASVQGLTATGSRRGCRTWRMGVAPPDPSNDNPQPNRQCAQVKGWSLHAGVRVPANQRRRLEHLCRYIARPAIANDRLREIPGGLVALELKKPFRDGTTHCVFTGVELIEKLAALIPPPRTHMLRYHGCLAASADLRPAIVPKPSPEPSTEPTTEPPLTEPATGPMVAPTPRPALPPSAIPKRKRIAWAQLLSRVFLVDPLLCRACGGRMKIAAFITKLEAVRQILSCLGLPTDPPQAHPARPPPQLPLYAGRDDDPPPDDFGAT